MLRKAKARVAEHRLTNVDGLAVMDAQHLGFPTRFDVVVAQYVITAVPNPEATLDEFARVARSPAARSCWSIISAPRAACARRSNSGSRRSRAGSAGGRNSAGSGWRNGLRGTAACASIERRADAAARAFFADPVCPSG